MKQEDQEGEEKVSIKIVPGSFYKHYVHLPILSSSSNSKEGRSLEWSFQVSSPVQTLPSNSSDNNNSVNLNEHTQSNGALAFGIFYLFDGLPDGNASSDLIQALHSIRLVINGHTLRPINASSTDSNEQRIFEEGEMIEIYPLTPLSHPDSTAMCRQTDLWNGQIGADACSLPSGTWLLYWDNSRSDREQLLSFSVRIQPNPDTANPLSTVTKKTKPSDPQPSPKKIAHDPTSSDKNTINKNSNVVLWEGWLAKKKRRRLPPGWTQRWFVLERSGRLSYYEHPPHPASSTAAANASSFAQNDDAETAEASPTTSSSPGDKENKEVVVPRGTLFLSSNCTITKVPTRKLLTIDCGSQDIWHLRALSDAEYAQWSDRLTAALHSTPLNNINNINNNNGFHGKDQEAVLKDVIAKLERLKGGKLGPRQQTEQLAECAQRLRSLLHSLATTSGTINHRRRTSLILRPADTKQITADETSSRLDDEEDVFYDVEEIILSDVSESEWAEGSPLSTTSMPPPTPQQPETKPPPQTLPAASLERQAHVLEEWPLKGQRLSLSHLPPSSPNISLAGLLWRCIGKDWSSLSLPVVLNEPLNALQRMAEELRYTDLLDRIASPGSSSGERAFSGQSSSGNDDEVVERLALAAVFVVSGYAGAGVRVDRKPFNPILGETYELDLAKARRFRFLGEKVSHRPLIFATSAASCDFVSKEKQEKHSIDDNQGQKIECMMGLRWTLRSHQSGKSKPWGKSIEYIPSGHTTLHLPLRNDTLRWTRVTSCARNVMSSAGSGGKWIELVGETRVTSQGTGYWARILFLPHSSNHRSPANNQSSSSSLSGLLKSASSQSLLSRSSPELSSVMSLKNKDLPSASSLVSTTSLQELLSTNGVRIEVFDNQGRRRCLIEGRWDDALYLLPANNTLNSEDKSDVSHSESVTGQRDFSVVESLWHAEECLREHRPYFGFGPMALHLNELTVQPTNTNDRNDNKKDGRRLLPTTDTRWRPDQRAMEHGDLDTAESIKTALEKKQRERRDFLATTNNSKKNNANHGAGDDGMDFNADTRSARWFEWRADGLLRKASIVASAANQTPGHQLVYGVDGGEWVETGQYWAIKDGHGEWPQDLPQLW